VSREGQGKKSVGATTVLRTMTGRMQAAPPNLSHTTDQT